MQHDKLPLCLSFTRFAMFHNVRIPRDNLLNRTGDVTPEGRYVTPFKVGGACETFRLSGALLGSSQWTPRTHLYFTWRHEADLKKNPARYKRLCHIMNKSDRQILRIFSSAGLFKKKTTRSDQLFLSAKVLVGFSFPDCCVVSG